MTDASRRKRGRLILGVSSLLIVMFAAGAWGLLHERPPLYPEDIMRRSEALHERMLSLDAHIDVPLDYGSEGLEANRDGPSQFDLAKAARSHLSGAALTIWSWPEIWGEDEPVPHRPLPGFEKAMQKEQEVRYRIITNIPKDYPHRAGIAHTPAEFRALAAQGKFAIVISMLNAQPFGDDIDQLDAWAARGMRVFGFSYIGNNRWADSSRPMPFFGDSPDELGGLSELGRRAVRRLNDLGVVIDVSQMSGNAVEQVTALTRSPIIASHSAVRGLVDIHRNLTDKELRLIKQTGGVVHIVGFPAYLKPFSAKTLAKVNELRRRFDLPDVRNLSQASMPGDPALSIWPEQAFGEYATALYAILEQEPKATLKDLGDAIDYTVRMIGIDHVGISSDFNHGGGLVGWEHVGDNRNVTTELMQRGYSDEDIAKLWGGNFLRVWEQVQQNAEPSENDPTQLSSRVSAR